MQSESPCLNPSSSSASLPSDPPSETPIITLFKSSDQKTSRKSQGNQTDTWIDLGPRGHNCIAIERPANLQSQAFLILKDDEHHFTGRPPRVNGPIWGTRATRGVGEDSKSVFFNVRNTAHYDHVRSFGTKFNTLTEAQQFLHIFNGHAVEEEDRQKVLKREKEELCKEVQQNTKSEELLEPTGICPQCNNVGDVEINCDNCGCQMHTLVNFEGSEEEDDSFSLSSPPREMYELAAKMKKELKVREGSVEKDSTLLDDTDDVDDMEDGPAQQFSQDWPTTHNMHRFITM